MEKGFFDTPEYRQFACLDSHGRVPDESTILRFRHRLEKYKLADQILATVNELLHERGWLLKEGTEVAGTLIAAPSSTKNKDKKRDPEMHSSQKGNEWHFAVKARIGGDAFWRTLLALFVSVVCLNFSYAGPLGRTNHRFWMDVAKIPVGY